jgi:peroxiredoxin
MTSSDNLYKLPEHLLAPIDDGACDHLVSWRLPSLMLTSTSGRGVKLIKRLTLIVCNGVIEKVFYPVFPPDHNAEEVIDWLSQNVKRN